MDILVKAGLKNEYEIKDRKFSKEIYNSFGFEKYNGEYTQVMMDMFGDFWKMTRKIKDSFDIDLRTEVIMEIFWTLRHLASQLQSIESLTLSLPVFRLFMDNIVRYYAFENNKDFNEEEVKNFDKKKNKRLQKVCKYNELFSEKIMNEYHASGAENHFGSLFNRNMGYEQTKVRNLNTLNSFKVILQETISIMADIIVRIAKDIGREQLALFEHISLIYFRMGCRIMEMEVGYV
ncbi:hypothetical protein [Mycoplasma todarodis]|uniref:Uncharacterized protein n=1 Tax=Mycoplasma todarodis TaxID=1937191 RepID=A0A4R0XN38_9MOLU|nr:hypothetical protein [Mycoplasma todarodis]TCG11971.1 hypothetical protein C4B25_00505 [Mycoplasma todarodis]